MTAWFRRKADRDAAMVAALARGAGVHRPDDPAEHQPLAFALRTSEHVPDGARA